jgi:hypothetical protein
VPDYRDAAGDLVGRSIPHTVDASGRAVAVTGTAPLPVASGAPAAANIRHGYLSFAATTSATTLVTVPAGRTWTGTLAVACATATAAASATAGVARAVVSVAGVGALPSGTVLAVEARAAANAATGTAGDSGNSTLECPLVVAAPAGNDVTIQVAATVTNGVVDVTATGALV